MARKIIVHTATNEAVLESIPVDPALLTSANWWFDVSWYGLLIAGGLTALAAFATVIFLFIQFWSSGVKERQTEWRTSALELQTETAKKETARLSAEAEKAREGIAQANAAGETAKADAAKANAEIATAKKQTAALENEAAQARLEQERLKAQLAWRTLAPDAKSNLETALARKPAQVNIQYPSGDTEAQYLAIQFANTFEKAGWQVAMFSATLHGTVAWGLFIPDPVSDATTEMRDAFAAAGLGFSTEALPPAGMGFGNSIPNAPILFIGSKPIPQPQ
jgi:hypothetical protein